MSKPSVACRPPWSDTEVAIVLSATCAWKDGLYTAAWGNALADFIAATCERGSVPRVAEARQALKALGIVEQRSPSAKSARSGGAR